MGACIVSFDNAAAFWPKLPGVAEAGQPWWAAGQVNKGAGIQVV